MNSPLVDSLLHVAEPDAVLRWAQQLGQGRHVYVPKRRPRTGTPMARLAVMIGDEPVGLLRRQLGGEAYYVPDVFTLYRRLQRMP